MPYIRPDFAAQYLAGTEPYYEGERQGAADITVPKRPDWSYEWNGTTWAVNAAKAARRQAEIDASTEKSSLKQDAQIAAFLAMTPAQRDTFVTADLARWARICGRIVANLLRQN